MESDLRFAVLGPVRAWSGQTELAPSSPQQCAVLAALLLHEGRQVSITELVDAVWGEHPPSSAVATIRTYVYRLRRVLASKTETDVISSVGQGYCLPYRTDACDLTRFIALTARARDERRDGELAAAAGTLRRALALWTGSPLAGVPGRYAETHRARLAELRLAAFEEQLEIDVELGRYVDAAVELNSLVATHPLRERFRELLMTALYGAGRQAEALAVYRDTQDLLRDELGVDPGPALQRLHARILRAEPGLSASSLRAHDQASAGEADRRPPKPAQLPADLAVFTGRETELKWLTDRLAPDRPAGSVIVTAIAGLGGVGKTTLAVHCGHQVAARYPDGQLYADLQGFGPGESPVRTEDALRGFLEALGVLAQAQPNTLDEQAALYRSLLNEQRILVVLDNARDAAQVRQLLPGSAGCAVLVTSRNRMPGLVVGNGAALLRLALPSAASARQALTIRLGEKRVAAERAAADEIVERCARLPLAIAIVAARALAEPEFPLAVIAADLRAAPRQLDALAGAGDGVADPRAVFSWSYRLLDAAAARLFRLLPLAQLDGDIAAPVAASLTGCSPAEARRLLHLLVGASMLSEHQPGRFALHDLMGEYATELSALEDSDDERLEARGRVLDHLLLSAYDGRVQMRLRAPARRPPPPRAGVTPEQIVSQEAARTWYAANWPTLLAAVRTAADEGFPDHAWRLEDTVHFHLERQGYWREWAAAAETAVAAALTLQDPATQASTRRSLAGAYFHLSRYDECLSQLDLVLDHYVELGDEEGQALAYDNLAETSLMCGRTPTAAKYFEQALGLYRLIDHQHGIAEVTGALGRCASRLGDQQKAIEHLYDALGQYRRLQDLGHEADILNQLAGVLCIVGDFTEALASSERCVELWSELDYRAKLPTGLLTLGDVHAARGDSEAAASAWQRGIMAAGGPGLPVANTLRTRLSGGRPTTDATGD